MLCYKQKMVRDKQIVSNTRERAGEHIKVHAFNQGGKDRTPVFLPLAVLVLSAV